MEKEIVYLCGGINGLTDGECNNWRSVAKAQLLCDTIDPMRRDYRGVEDAKYKEIVEGDKADISESTIILANCTRPSWGTAMEIQIAWSQNKKILAVFEPPISPWLRYHATFLFSSLTIAIEAINCNLRGSP